MGETIKTYFTAKEARERMLESQVLLNRVFREVKECYNEGRNKARWLFIDTAPEVKENIIKTLREHEFTVDFDPMVETTDNEEAIIIAW